MGRRIPGPTGGKYHFVSSQIQLLSPTSKSGPLPLRGVSSLIDVPKSPSLAHRKPRELSYTSVPFIGGVGQLAGQCNKKQQMRRSYSDLDLLNRKYSCTQVAWQYSCTAVQLYSMQRIFCGRAAAAAAAAAVPQPACPHSRS